MSTRQITQSTLWQLASQVAMAALSIVTVKCVAMGLSKELAGVYNSSYGFLQVFGILADFGLYAVSVREVSRSENKSEILGALFVLRLCILCLSLGSALLLVWSLPQWENSYLRIGVSIAAFTPFFTLLAGMIRTVFQVHYRMHYVFLAEVGQRILTVTLVLALLFTSIRGSTDPYYLKAFLWVGSLGSLFLFSVSFFCARRIMPLRPCFKKEILLSLLKKATPYGLAFLCMALYREFDLTMIALLREDFEIQNAYYGFVVRMAAMGFTIPTFLLNSTLPKLSQLQEEDKDTSRLLGKTLLVSLLIGSVAALFSTMWSRPLIALLTTESYLSTSSSVGSDTALRILSIPLFFNTLVIYGFYVLLATHRWKPLLSTLLFGATLSIALNLAFIPSQGFVGAALTTGIVHIVLASILVPLSLRTEKAKLHWSDIRSLLLFCTLVFAGLWCLLPLLTSSITTAIGLLCMTVLMGVGLKVTGLLKSLT